jgi:hypothetical protein
MASKVGALQEKPNGTVRWAAWMDKLIAVPLRRYGPTPLSSEASLENNLERFCSHYRGSYSDQNRALLCLLKWHGLAVLDTLLSVVPVALGGKQQDDEFLKIALALHDERVVDAMLPYVNLLAVRQTLHKQAERWLAPALRNRDVTSASGSASRVANSAKPLRIVFGDIPVASLTALTPPQP